jgi:hypothetical protein
MSQFCGSLSALTSRSGVTSPAIAGHAAIAAALASSSLRIAPSFLLMAFLLMVLQSPNTNSMV